MKHIKEFKLNEFLDYPWQEDLEIDFVKLIDEYRNNILKSSKYTIQNYIKRLSEQLTNIQMLSDKFIFDLDELIK
jgi:hypothetical protein